jgi:serine/threonine-protein kinase
LLGPATPPKKIGRYQVEEEIGRGMMGAVYRAFDPLLDRQVAVKVIHPGLPLPDEELKAFEQRFLAEGRIVARLSHPGIVTLHEVGEDAEAGVPYLVLELLVGRTLREVIADGKLLEWKRALGIIARIAHALGYAHQEQVVHRDIKPANIMLLEDGSAKLMDFGIARLQAGFGLTSTGQLLGTPLYMSPEQALGDPIDGRSDLFSLGSVGYTLLTGQPAFQAESVPVILGKVARHEPPPPSSLQAKLPAALDYVCARALHKQPDARYQTGKAFAEDLEDVMAGKPPRHKSGWAAPAQVTAGGTLMAPASPLSAAHPGATVTTPPVAARPAQPARPAARPRPKPRRRGTRWLLLLASVGTLAALLVNSGYWRTHLRPLLRPSSETERQQALTSLEVAADEAATRVQEGARRLAALVEEERDANAAPTQPGAPLPATGAPVPAPALDEPVVSMASEDAATIGRLSLSVVDGVPDALLSIWLDDVLVYRGRLAGGPEPIVFRLAEGGYHGVLTVEPGDHVVRARLETAAGALEDQVPAAFTAGLSRHLDIHSDPDRLRLVWHGTTGAAEDERPPSP